MNATFWQEDVDEEQYVVPDNVVDLIFKIKCPTLPVDHAWSLSVAIHQALPWFPDEQQAGLHLVYGADSGNGWERPSDGGETLYLSRRTPLILRLPKERVEDAAALTGETLDIEGNKMEIGASHTRFLAMSTTLYCRYLVAEPTHSEDEFLQSAVDTLHELNLRFKKVLCGKGTTFATPQDPISTRSLMVAGLSLDDAITLQEQGMGPLRERGFGLFVPHKTV
ncbi:MAG: type I-MYXAN CRISPR-associated protein Cas6/Cmx6 [Candidatus Thiodiazotropha sp. (ex Monitilora ramsayi)]|nr:type I-MYXAN CRISPR-associated protein Cas6/Cmx6 [Candidatus Thiodiazotropha sp. (ex Monitilora ramsayi)]